MLWLSLIIIHLPASGGGRIYCCSSCFYFDSISLSVHPRASGRNYCCCSCSCFGSPSLSYISRLVAEAEFTAAPPASTLTPSHYQYIPVPVAEIIVAAPAHALALPHYHTSPG
ncbi:hypothetical protein ACOSP7_004203 [Xanthoceras sorbifolium]